MEIATLLLIILAVFTAFFLTAFQYLCHSKYKSQLKYWLSFFRFITIFLTLILLISPSIKKNTTKIAKPNLIVAVDNSASIKYNSQDINVKKLVSLFKNNVELNSKYLINYYSFGSSLVELDSLKFNESQTNLSIPFTELSKLFQSKNAPVVFITDGNQTVGNNIEFVTHENPIFSFIVGDTTQFEDIFIKQLNVNKFTNINNKFPVEIFINYTGNKSISNKLNIYKNKTKVHTETIKLNKGETVKTASFFLTATAKGTHYYRATISELENEKNTLNNSKYFSINVIDEKFKILILSSIIHPDLGMLKKSIESNKQRSVDIENISDFKGRVSDYHMIILNQPTNKFKNVIDEVNHKKISYLIVSGVSTDWNFLNKTQNIFSKKIFSQVESYKPLFNPNYASFLTNDIGFSSFAPLDDSFGDVTFSIPYNTLLFKQIGSIKTEKPLLATYENNNQRGAILFGENSWRWRMNSFSSSKTFEYFDGYISNLIQYLASSQQNKRLTVSVEPIYYSDETISISASYLDENLNFDARAKLWFTISNKENNYFKKIPFALLQSKFSLELSNIPSGEYTYNLSVENQTTTKMGSFKILPYNAEQKFTNANDSALKLLSSKTEGNIYFSNEEDRLIENLIKDSRFKSIQKKSIIETPLINWKWILAIIILTLSIEWFTRKYFGKI